MAKSQTKTAATFQVETLTRGQKAAATRKANAEKRAAEHAAQVARAKRVVRAKVDPKKVRASALAAKAREEKAKAKRKAQLAAARAAHEAGKAKALTDKRTKSLADIRREGKGALHALRAAAVEGATKGKRSGYAYAAALNAAFSPDWVNFKKEQANKNTNHGITVTAFFAEKDSYFAAFHANHDGVGKANPAAYWANLKKYAQTLMTDGIEKKRGAGNVLEAKAALKRDLPGLYLRANNDKGFEGDDKLQQIAAKLGEVIALLGMNLGEINQKIGK